MTTSAPPDPGPAPLPFAATAYSPPEHPRRGTHQHNNTSSSNRRHHHNYNHCAARTRDAAVSMQAVHSSGSRQRDFLRHQWRQHGSTALAAAAAIGWGLYLWERRWGRRQQAASSGDAATAAVNTPKQ